MKLRRIFAAALLPAMILCLVGLAEAEAANGIIKVTFKHLDTGGVEQPLRSAYLYLRKGDGAPPLEEFYRKADFIFGPSDSSGRISASVPAGSYFIRLTRRAPLTGTADPLGPPRKGDYTWTDYRQVTVTANTTTDLGVRLGEPFSEPITISGAIVRSGSGAPLAGRYVRAQTEPCVIADYSSEDPGQWVDSNRCGPVKYLALQRTDAQGRYTLQLRDPGTYYIVESITLGDNHQQYTGNPGTTGWAMGPVTVQAGERIVLEDMRVPAGY